MFFDVLLCRKECESITEAHVGIASLPFIKKDFDFIILLIFSVFFGGVRFWMPKQVRVKIVVILWAIYIRRLGPAYSHTNFTKQTGRLSCRCVVILKELS